MSDCWDYKSKMALAKIGLRHAIDDQNWSAAATLERRWKKYRELYHSSDEYRTQMAFRELLQEVS